ncbi:MAG: tRNA glutamyl-Q(34) synthetase GluQRS [Gammaproteobacteria bacterium]|nr:tRNA glutamyl-Q(34) synthetase GluQRS [Gammaproteobacteria bacterium]
MLNNGPAATANQTYRGRFAPSPTGPLHFGSLIAAMASYLDARAAKGKWLVRIDDLDPPREVQGSAEMILRTLEMLGFEWDESVLFQSSRHAAYTQALEILAADNKTYPCGCTRREIADSVVKHTREPIYPGTCRNGLPVGKQARSVRVRTEDAEINFHDHMQGTISQDLSQAVGDYVLRRADGLFAYQLAVVVDDAAQAISHIVRGADLLDSTPRQIYLQKLLSLPTPEYAHLPIAIDSQGKKLSKQHKALAVDTQHPQKTLLTSLEFLNQKPQKDLVNETVETIWRWAVANWRPDTLAGIYSKKVI